MGKSNLPWYSEKMEIPSLQLDGDEKDLKRIFESSYVLDKSSDGESYFFISILQGIGKPSSK